MSIAGVLAIALEEEYNKGLAEGWELAKKVACTAEDGGIPDKEMDEMLGKGWTVSEALSEHTPQEFKEKIEAYEQGKGCKAGTVIRHKTYGNLLVTGTRIDNYVSVIDAKGVAMVVNNVVKLLERKIEEINKKISRATDNQHLLALKYARVELTEVLNTLKGKEEKLDKAEWQQSVMRKFTEIN